VRGTADRLETEVRKAMDPRSIIRRHPGETAAVVAGLAFLILGGPRRTVRFVRRSVRGAADGERAYASLPPVLRSLVDDSAPGFGESKAEAKRQMALALHAWRADPKNRKKAEQLVSLTLTPPGPDRTFWSLVEVVAVAAAAILTRQVLTKRLSDFLGSRPAAVAPPAADTTTSSSRVAASPGPADTGYTGWSGRQASVAGPAKDPKAPPAKTPQTPAKTGS
jgi:hypothetical protein